MKWRLVLDPDSSITVQDIEERLSISDVIDLHMAMDYRDDMRQAHQKDMDSKKPE